MQISATLNTGKPKGNCKKSTTWPSGKPGERVSRSMRFPTMPPSKTARVSDQERAVVLVISQMTTSAAMLEIRVKIQVAPKPIENAAESFQIRKNWSTSPTNGTERNFGRFSMAKFLVHWSTAIRAIEINRTAIGAFWVFLATTMHRACPGCREAQSWVLQGHATGFR